MAFQSRCVAGSFTGNGTSQSVSLGFQPDAVLIYNETDGDSLHLHFSSMAAGTGIDIGAAVAALAANGVTLSSRGFSVGSAASVNESAKVMRFLAIG